MTFFSGLLLIVEKEFRHFRHDPLTLVLIVLAPLSQLVVFGYALDPRFKNVPIAIQDLDGGRYSRSLASDFDATSLFRIVRHAGSEKELLLLLRRCEIRVAIQIPAGYSSAVFYRRPANVRVWIDGSDAVLAAQAVQTAEAVGLKQIAGSSVPGLPSLPRMLVRPEVLFNPERRPVNFFVPGMVAMLLQTTTMLLVALSFVKEREQATLDQLRITTITVPSLIGGKLTAAAVTGLATGLILATLMRVVFGIPIAGSVSLLCLALVLFLPSALGLGLIVTAHARNQAQALQMSFLIGIPSVLLSGFAFPRESMPEPVYWVTTLLPTTWSLVISRGIVLRGANALDLAPAFGACLLLGIIYVSIGAMRLRRTLL